MKFNITATHTGQTVATLERVAFLDAWICSPSWCDMGTRDRPVDGYTFDAPGESAAVCRGDLQGALLKLAERGHHSISIRGIEYLRRLAKAPLQAPQPITRR